MSINKHFKIIKKAIKKHTQLIDTYFLIKYAFSPYMACEHGCKYCDGRAEKYYVAGDFEKDIIIRKNLPELLSLELKKLREPGLIFIGSGISDAYQPIEKEEKLMREAAKILLKFNFPVAVMTKSSLILRDLDIWSELNKKNGFILMLSLTMLDDKVRNTFEPNASSVEERLETLRKFKEKGIPVGISGMPFIPFITNKEKDLRELLTELKSIPVDFMFYGSLTLRPGCQKQFFMKVIKEKYPNLLQEFKVLYGEDRASGSPLKSYSHEFFNTISKLLMEFEIPTQIPHYLYKGKFSLYDEIFILLNHMTELYKSKGIKINRLLKALKNYSNWILEEKKYFNRRRNLSYELIEDKIRHRFKTGEFNDVLQNEKLFQFLKQIVLEEKTLDYNKLKIV
ncbi:radical SAM protein [Candidatus Dependentiae bacterium]|nr:radical SAM protein [Candidatus Dependentiae bacterium]